MDGAGRPVSDGEPNNRADVGALATTTRSPDAPPDERRSGSGRYRLTAREKMIQRAGQRFLREKLVPKALRRLGELVQSKDEKVARLAVKEILGRGGFPLSKEIIADIRDSKLTPEQMAKAYREAAERAIQHPERGDVVAEDAEFEMVRPTNGAEHTVQ